MIQWFKQVQHSPHNSVMSFFAAFDTPDQSMPAPFNAQSLPINLRLYNKFKTTTSAVVAENEMDFLLEGLDKRV